MASRRWVATAAAAVALTASIAFLLPQSWTPVAWIPLLQAPLQAVGAAGVMQPSLAQLGQVEKLHASGRLITYIGACAKASATYVPPYPCLEAMPRTHSAHSLPFRLMETRLVFAASLCCIQPSACGRL